MHSNHHHDDAAVIKQLLLAQCLGLDNSSSNHFGSNNSCPQQFLPPSLMSNDSQSFNQQLVAALLAGLLARGGANNFLQSVLDSTMPDVRNLDSLQSPSSPVVGNQLTRQQKGLFAPSPTMAAVPTNLNNNQLLQALLIQQQYLKLKNYLNLVHHSSLQMNDPVNLLASSASMAAQENSQPQLPSALADLQKRETQECELQTAPRAALALKRGRDPSEPKLSGDKTKQLDDESSKHKNGTWTESEHKLFLQGLAELGAGKWKDISLLIPTRTADQTRSHAQKYFKKMRKNEEKAALKRLRVEENEKNEEQDRKGSESTESRAKKCPKP
uniref:HTH myb-type domain-containing protein n=1 Tax=Heterosigma akashiwo TaxID=2829 RepID=A0A7S3XLB2_HETAK